MSKCRELFAGLFRQALQSLVSKRTGSCPAPSLVKVAEHRKRGLIWRYTSSAPSRVTCKYIGSASPDSLNNFTTE